MPVAWLTDDHAQRYGRYTGEPTADPWARVVYLDDADRALVVRRREDPIRVGLALQLGTVRFLGTCLTDPTDVPPGVVTSMSRQLRMADPLCWPRYRDRRVTRHAHAQDIQRRYGDRDVHAPREVFRLVRWLYTRAWLSAERPSVLFDLATARLVEPTVGLPGVSVLERRVASIRDHAAARLWQRLAQLPNADQQARLEALVPVPDGARLSPLDRLRRAPTRVSSPAVAAACHRLEEIRTIGVSALAFDHLPPHRLRDWARYGAAARAQAMARMAPDRRLAIVLAFAHAFEVMAMDDALDRLDLVMTELVHAAECEGQQARLRTLRDLDTAALQLWEALQLRLDAPMADAAVRRQTFAQIPRQRLVDAGTQVETLARPPDDHDAPELVDRSRRVRLFVPALFRTVAFDGTQAGQPRLTAGAFLGQLEHHHHPDRHHAPLDLVPGAWRRLVLPRRPAVADRRAYPLCLMARLHDRLRRRDVCVRRSERWGDPRVNRLHGPQGETLWPQVCRALSRSEWPEPALHALAPQLDTAYQRTAAHVPTNAAVRVEQVKGRDTLTLTGLDTLEAPASLVTRRDHVLARLPQGDLPEVLLDIHARTGFAHECTQSSAGAARVADLPISLWAVLLAEACHIGLKPVVRADIPARTRSRLSWVQHNALRAETLVRAHACLVETQTTIPLAQEWGGGEVASADGLRFVVPVRPINAGPNRQSFNAERGVTDDHFTSDQCTGFHAIVIPGTLRDSMCIFDGLLAHQTRLRPMEIMTDTAGVSAVVFGLFWLLGSQVSPRLADIGEAQFWRVDRRADDGVLNGMARSRVHTTLMARNWEDLWRVAGSLHQGTVSASERMRSLLRSQRPSTLTRAIGALGRLPKTRYLLAYVDDERYRRRLLTQLNRGERRHRVARAVFHGQRGELRQRYRDGQEDQLGALGLVVKAMVWWNTLYMAAALTQVREDGLAVQAADVTRLSPVVHQHINFQGRYAFALSEAVARGELRPLRNPDEPNEDGEWWRCVA